jgi:hypothetical protein
MLVEVTQLIRDEAEHKAWDVWLSDVLSPQRGSWVRAALWTSDDAKTRTEWAASLWSAPSALVVVARPTPAQLCEPYETPADPLTREDTL